ncbi:glycosyltransferase family 2 protein [Vibrio mediterranei]|uniref:glycosyltransferase family 2 protein n=1 Tax=Vibrio mediterranei TaxID=689 RepID=UPI0040680159
MKVIFDNSLSNSNISIVVPVYNVSSYVLDTLDSICSLGSNVKLIVVNDGSTDDSLDVVLDYMSKNQVNGVLIDKENGGLSEARNTGFDFVNTPLVSFVDSDDIICRNPYRFALETMIENDLDLIIGKGKCFDDVSLCTWSFEDEFVFSEEFSEEQKYKIYDSKSRKDNLYLVEPNTSIRIFKTEFFKNNELSYPKGLQFEDVYIHFLMVSKATKIALLNEYVLLYRMNREGKITSAKSNRRFDILKAVESSIENKSFQNLTVEEGAKIAYQLTKISTWCGKYVPTERRLEFFQELSSLLCRLPSVWTKAAIYDLKLDFRISYVLFQLVTKGDYQLVNSLTVSKINKLSVVYFLLKTNRIKTLTTKLRERI